ncbi:MAG: DUF1345 domain-containing protein [Acidobacteria bacterium]|nr:DUF1345 domain-containing protein [Acidobacteriota bacterium]
MSNRARRWPHSWEPEPRWPALVAVVSVGGIYAALPRYLILGPRWLFPGVVFGLLVPAVVTHVHGHQFLNRFFGFTVNGAVTACLIASVALLIEELPAHRESPTRLLLSAASLWFSNVLVFALWYWRLDAGGPHGRDSRPDHLEGAFLFPQMTLQSQPDEDDERWSPNFVDYLFLAFNTSTAFSPTDAPVLQRWAKMLMMLQSLISLTVLALLAARAVNIL